MTNVYIAHYGTSSGGEPVDRVFAIKANSLAAATERFIKKLGHSPEDGESYKDLFNRLQDGGEDLYEIYPIDQAPEEIT